MNKTSTKIEDERVGKHFENVLDGKTYLALKAVLYDNKKFLTLVEVFDEKKKKFNRKYKLPKHETVISWYYMAEDRDGDAIFYVNFIEM